MWSGQAEEHGGTSVLIVSARKLAKQSGESSLLPKLKCDFAHAVVLEQHAAQ